MEEKSKAPIWIIGIVVAAVVLVSGYLLLNQNNKSTDTEVAGNIDTSNATTGTKEGAVNSTTSQYSDGVYTAEGKYYSPGGEQTIELELTIADGRISAVDLSGVEPDLESSRYQQKFNAGLENLVVGKKIEESFITGRVNGSSLTADGFNDALDSIIEQAQVS